MSDPYSPYQAPSPYLSPTMPYSQAPPEATFNRAAQIAAWLVLVVVLLQVVQSGISIFYYTTAPVSEFTLDAQRAQFGQLGMSEDAIRTVVTLLIGGCSGLIVLLLLVMFPFVRRGARGATITTLVIAGLLALFAVMGLLGGVIQLSGALDAPNMPKPATWFTASGVLMSALMLLTQIALIVYLAKSLIHRSRQAQMEAGLDLQQQQAAWQAYYAQQQPPPPGDQNWGGPS